MRENERLRRIRQAKNMSLEEAAGMIGTSADQLSKLERGDRKITTNWLNKILPAYQMTQVEFYGGETDPVTVPLLGSVPAGMPMLIDAASLLDAPRFTFPQAKPNWYAVRVCGDSMNLVAQDGYVLVINPIFECADLNGRFVVANYNGEATFKRYRSTPLTMLEPRSTNSQHQSIVPSGDDELVILGVVEFIIADMRT